MQQNRIIIGIVTDEDGNPLLGVSVVVKGTDKGVATDFDGKFSLEIAPDAKMLEISSVGFITQEVAIAGKSSFTIVLKEDTQQLEEVIVVGYGVQRRGDVTTAILRCEPKIWKTNP
ncbi:carboxypeptidase-like regulatory domain-containing protein [Capnocytophaga catalasegens]|uniref:SusC/RagA family TonB-linked outer membrane protein n=1 Tax=Capnocytophaga catalasegens TaxID=1004260 RepID=A0AAV5B108_9FLAO|nr:carboxypeptidase-like regulatory domain-containing protein [Capnocytophaga catalasegens]GIZ14364.1 hypothetical protein RCZ03_03650 [Capnocytophaga catalasegens]GJM51277.1 hypothetical protein RCZ15_22500 [Capnocytophaga catalasegens]GJM53304.1 hypothetical protein RCZ16_16210 [Capnocytophaga catalasegens]